MEPGFRFRLYLLTALVLVGFGAGIYAAAAWGLRVEGRNEVAAIGNGISECAEAFRQPRDADRRRPHIDTASSGAEVEGNSNEMD